MHMHLQLTQASAGALTFHSVDHVAGTALSNATVSTQRLLHGCSTALGVISGLTAELP